MYKVLIVDDEMIVRHAMKAMIRWEEGTYELSGTASNGKKALEHIRQYKPDIVITDIKMPDMDGIGLIKELKAIGFEGEILVLSNHQDFELVKEAMKYGVHDYVLKLTVQSEDFMRYLSEMAAKIDLRSGSRVSVNKRDEQMDAQQRKEWLERVVASQGILSSQDEARVQLELPALGSEERLIALSIKLAERSSTSESKLIHTLIPIADDLFRSSVWHTIVQADDQHGVIFASYARNDCQQLSEQLAARISGLASLYYNQRVQVVYTCPVSSYAELAKEIKLCISAAPLFFYQAFEGTCLSNRKQPSDDESLLETLESSLKNLSPHRLWSDDKDGFMSDLKQALKQGAEELLDPRMLKKRIIKLMWEIEKLLLTKYGNKEAVLIDNWEEEMYEAATEQECLDIVHRNIDQLLELGSSDGKISKPEVKQALLYIEQHFTQKISVLDIAKHVNLSEAYLCKIFKMEVKKSIVTYMNELRLQKAHGLLIEGQVLVKEAAAAVGIDDPFYFNRLFKRYYGISPKEIRK